MPDTTADRRAAQGATKVSSTTADRRKQRGAPRTDSDAIWMLTDLPRVEDCEPR